MRAIVVTEVVTVGSTVKIRIFLFNGAIALAGRTVNLSIERLSDGQFWNGSAFQSGFVTVAMSELTGNSHREGVYEYSLVTESVANVYDWSVKFTEGSWVTYFKGRIRTDRHVWDEPITSHLAVDSVGYEIHLAKAALVNKRVHTIATGVDLIKDNDGDTTLRTLTPTETAGVITVTPT